jgi:hypothetical protein
VTGPWWLARDDEDAPDMEDVTFGRSVPAAPMWPIPVDPWAIPGPVGPDPF